MITTIESIYSTDTSILCKCPVPFDKISAGFPSDVCDQIEGYLNLNEHLIKNPVSTFFLRVAGDSMIKAGIFPGDILIVDKSLVAEDKNVVVAVVNEEFVVKRYKTVDSDAWLVDEKGGADVKYRNFEIWLLLL